MTVGGDNRFDVAVIGAGHNGLACAALLAKAGRKVIVLESRDRVGGLAVGDPLGDFDQCTGVWHDTSLLRPRLVESLSLERHGLSLVNTPAVFVPQSDGPGLLLYRNPAIAATEIASHSKVDADSYARYRAMIAKVQPIITRVLDRPPPDVTSTNMRDMLGLAADGWALRKLGRDAMFELLRIPPMCVADWLGEWFESELLRCALAAPALIGSFSGPWSPASAGLLLRHEAMSGMACADGPGAVITALASAATQAGAKIRTNAAVEQIRVSNGAACGITLASGEKIDANIVATSCDPKTVFLKLIAGRELPAQLEHDIATYRCTGTTAKVDLLLSSPLKFKCRPEASFEHVRIAESIDDMERAFDAVKYNRPSETPILDIYAPASNQSRVAQARGPSTQDDAHSDQNRARKEADDVTKRTPSKSPTSSGKGAHYASIIAHFAPYDLEGGWSDTARENLGDAIIGALEKHAPGATSTIQQRRVLTPRDIEQTFNVWCGHIHHGDPGLDQLVIRPTLQTSRYATPISGLYLCGSGSHPGGGLTGGPGMLAADMIQHHDARRTR